MQKNLILYLILLLLVIIFAVQNYEAATIRLYFWNIKISTGLLITIVFIAGVLIGLLTSSLANNQKMKKLRAEGRLVDPKKEQEKTEELK
jgi:uncharacterized integral membrane protein